MMYQKEIIAHKKAITFVSGCFIVVAIAAKVLFHQMTVYDSGITGIDFWCGTNCD